MNKFCLKTIISKLDFFKCLVPQLFRKTIPSFMTGMVFFKYQRLFTFGTSPNRHNKCTNTTLILSLGNFPSDTRQSIVFKESFIPQSVYCLLFSSIKMVKVQETQLQFFCQIAPPYHQLFVIRLTNGLQKRSGPKTLGQRRCIK